MSVLLSVPGFLANEPVRVALAALVVSALVHRPLLVSAVSVDLARAQGIRVRAVSLAHALALALAVALAAMTVGAILSTALLIGPAAAALRVARRPAAAVVLAAAIGLGATWGGIVLAYESFYWTPGRGWPVSFFIVALVFAAYLLAGALAAHQPRRAAAPPSGCERH